MQLRREPAVQRGREPAVHSQARLDTLLIRTTRQRRGWSQLTLANHAGLDAKTVQRIAAGRGRRPTRRTLGRLAAALGLPFGDLERAAAEGRDG